MKKLLAFVLTIVLAATAWAGTVKYDGGFFTIDVPEEWNVQKRNDGMMVVLTSADQKVAFTLIKTPLEGTTIKQAMERLNTQYQGSGVEGDDKSGYEIQSANFNGLATYIQAFDPTDDGKVAIIVCVSGDKDSKTTEEIFNSIKMKD